MAQPVTILELYLVRHGESMSNAGTTDGLSQEFQTDTPLSEKGVRQAKLLGEYFHTLPLDCIFTSGLRRSVNTGYEVSLRQPENGARQVRVHGIFTECGTGEDCEGRTIPEIRTEFPTVIAAEGVDPLQKQIYHGKNDTDEQLLCRAKQALRYITERYHNGEKVMVAAHAAFDTFLLYAALGMSHEQIFDPQFHNTGITKIVFFKEGTGAFADVHLVYHNAVPHLLHDFPELRF